MKTFFQRQVREESIAWPTLNLLPAAGSITSFTVNAARLKRLSRFVYVYLDFTVSNNGTGSGGFIQGNIPFSTGAGARSVIMGRNITNGNAVSGYFLDSSNTINITRFDGVYPVASGQRIILSGWILETV